MERAEFEEEEIDESEEEEEEEDAAMEEPSFEARKREASEASEEELSQDLEAVLSQADTRRWMQESRKFADKERINLVYSLMNDAQRERFETFRQSNFDEKRMKKVLQLVLGPASKMQKNILAVIKSVAKVYVGQLVEEAKLVQLEEQPDAAELGPVCPHHLQEARRRLALKGELVPERPKPMFKRKPTSW